jgi:hypothetical protein
MKVTKSKYRKPTTAVQCWLVQEPETGEAPRIYCMTGTKQQIDNELKKDRVRLFVDGVDSRGPSVKIMLTYGLREGEWFYETEGSYFIAFTGELPEHLRRHRLHFGNVSTPQPTKSAIHRLFLDIITKTPELKPYLKCIKMACVFCKDHPDAPGKSSIDIPLESLPAPSDPNKVARFYM